jgi:hypothetical protein
MLRLGHARHKSETRMTRRAMIFAGALLLASCKGTDIPSPELVPVKTAPVNDLGPASNWSYGFNIVGLFDPAYSDGQRRMILGWARQTGFKWVRLPFGWQDFQPSSSSGYNHGWRARADSIVDAIGDSLLAPFITLQGTPWWARGCSSAATCEPNYVKRPAKKAYWPAWKNFVQDMALRYPSVAYWGIGNEPNDSSQWIPDSEYVTAACTNGGDWLEAYKFQLVNAADALQPLSQRIVVAPDLGDGPSSCVAPGDVLPKAESVRP